VIHYEIIPVIVIIFQLFWALLTVALSPVRHQAHYNVSQAASLSLSLKRGRNSEGSL